MMDDSAWIESTNKLLELLRRYRDGESNEDILIHRRNELREARREAYKEGLKATGHSKLVSRLKDEDLDELFSLKEKLRL